jgi:hypothetical protein
VNGDGNGDGEETGAARRLGLLDFLTLARLGYYAYGELADSEQRLAAQYPNWVDLAPRRRAAWVRTSGVLTSYVRLTDGPVDANGNAAGVPEHTRLTIARLLENEVAPWHR